MKILIILCCLSLTNVFGQSLKTEEGYKDVNGAKIYYKTIGQGEPILFLHGGPGLEHSYFLPHFNELAKKYKLIFFDYRGHGKSDGDIDSAHIQLSYFVKDVEEMRKAFGIERVILVGHLFGGLLAESYALQYPSHVQSLILISPSSHESKYTVAASKVIKERVTQQDMIDRETIMSSPEFYRADPKAYENIYRVNLRTVFYDKTNIDSLQLSFPVGYKERSDRLMKMYPEEWFYFPGNKLQNIFSPVLIVYGDYDPTPKECFEDLRHYLLRSTLLALPNSGQFPFIESKQKFFEEIEKFLEGIISR